VAEGLVYVGSYDYKLYCLNASTGTFKWSFPSGGQVKSSPAVADGKVYVGSSDNNLYCLNASTGALIWDYNVGYATWSSPAVANGIVYIGSEGIGEGFLLAFGSLTYINKVEYDVHTFSVPIISNSMISDFNFDQPMKEISFNVTGATGIAGLEGFCTVTIPTQLLGSPYTVYIDGSPVTPDETYTATQATLHFNYTHSTHKIQIIGTTVIPEFPTTIMSTLILTIIVLTVLFTRRRTREF
jgi:hypothetical protein